MAKVLNVAARSALQSKLKQAPSNVQRYSRFPVHETEFWLKLFAFAKDPKTARRVLEEIGEIEGEPCIDNDRVFNSVRTARNLANLALIN
jgi:hypothetical protein